MRRIFLLIGAALTGAALLGLIAASAWAEGTPAHLSLGLGDLVASALDHSPQLRSAMLNWNSARDNASSLGDSEFPRLGLSANYFYQTYVPKFAPVPGGPQAVFGEENNWSAWGTLNWDLWDFRSLHSQADSAQAMASSQEQQVLALKRRLTLAVRLAYFQVQAGLDQVRLLGDSLHVAQAQYADIQKQAKYGTASQVDRLSSHQEVLDYQRQFRSSQATLASSLRDLFALVGIPEPGDFRLPMDPRMEGKLPDGVPPPSVWITMDPKPESFVRLSQEVGKGVEATLPQLKTYAFLADSARSASDAVKAGLLPKIQLSAQAGWENPDGPVLQTVQQNIVSLNATMPLFDFGSLLSESDSQQRHSEAYLADLDQARLDLNRDWAKARDQLDSIAVLKGLDDQAVSETDELANLTYGAYRAGTLRFLEVQTANFRALGAKTQAAGNEIQELMQLSILSSLSGKE